MIGRAPLAVAALLFWGVGAACLPAQRALRASLRDQLAALPKTAKAVDHGWFAPGFERVELPGAGDLHGLAHVAGRLWLARGEELLGLELGGLAVKARLPRPEGLRALCADDRHLYALVGDRSPAVAVLDARAGVEVRRFALALDDLAFGDRVVTIGAGHGRGLGVLTGRSFRVVDPATGATLGAPRRPIGVMSRMHWLHGDEHGWRIGNSIGAFSLVCREDPQRAEPLGRHRTEHHSWMPLRLRASRAVLVDGRLLLAAETRAGEGVVAHWIAPRPVVRRHVLHVHRPGRKAERWSVEYGDRQPREGALADLGEALVAWRRDHPETPAQVELRADPEVEVGVLVEAWDAVAGIDPGVTVRFPAFAGWLAKRQERR